MLLRTKVPNSNYSQTVGVRRKTGIARMGLPIDRLSNGTIADPNSLQTHKMGVEKFSIQITAKWLEMDQNVA